MATLFVSAADSYSQGKKSLIGAKATQHQPSNFPASCLKLKVRNNLDATTDGFGSQIPATLSTLLIDSQDVLENTRPRVWKFVRGFLHVRYGEAAPLW